MSENNNGSKSEEVTETAKETRTAVGVRFKSCGKIYTFEIGDIDIAPGTKVVVESEPGVALGTTVKPKHKVMKPKDPLKKVLRIATEKDLDKAESNAALEEEARTFCIEKAKEYNLDMKVVSAEITLDGKKFVFYFTSDGRVDFRELVRDLASKFKTRIEMRQIGVRDEVKLIGGLGACGRQACCNLFLTSFAPVTIKMAKQQNLSINQSKLSGVCGRLMCCLGYECKSTYGEERRERLKDRESDVSYDSSEEEIIKEKTGEGLIEKDETVDLKQGDKEVIEKKGPSGTSPEKTEGEKKQRSRGRRRRRRPRGASAARSEGEAGKEKKESAETAEGDSKKKKSGSFKKKRRFRKKKSSENKNEPPK